MKSITWLYLSLILTGTIYHDILWASRGHHHVGGHRTHSGGGYGIGSHYSGGRHAHSGRRTSFYGGISFGSGYAGFGRGYPAYGSYYHRPYYRGSYFNSGFYGPAWPAPFYPYAYPQVITVPATPPVYIQQPPVILPSPPAVVTRSNYWHYCEQPAGYYPQVKNCPGGWILVPPRHDE